MPIIEDTPQRLVLKSGTTLLTLDRNTSKATLQRKLVFWSLKPAEAALSEITDVSVDSAVDRASGVEVCHTMLVLHGGQGWAFPAAGKVEAQATAAALRRFLAIEGQ
jgi:hypothetical protein